MTIKFDDEKTKEKISAVRQIEEDEALQRKAESEGLPYINLFPNAIEGDALRLVPENKAREANLIPFKLDLKKIFIAFNDPNDQKVRDIIKNLKAGGYETISHITSLDSIKKCLEIYKGLSFTTASAIGSMDITEEALTQYLGKVRTIADVQVIISQNAGKNSLTELLEIILSGAIATRASDVHIEPEEKEARLRYRLDGMLYDVSPFNLRTFNLILSRIKLLSGLKLNVKSEAQDGRFAIVAGGEEIEIRTSIVPGGYGESIVLRILNPKSIEVSLETLGINSLLLPIIKDLINRPQGMILTTGPTGSGKTTTLYSFMRSVYTPELKILTIEDPIEYKLKGIVQTQVEEERGYTFLEGLRSALRQDPDIIMVGEIRDEETARTAIDAALTGHLVFSTLHTNNAAGAFTRLIDLGVNPKVITSAVTAAMAQRLVRKLCPKCRKQIKLEGKNLEVIESIAKNIKKKMPGFEIAEKIWTSEGCDQCNGTGYAGRVGVYELILSDKDVEEAIRQNPSERDIKNAAEPQKILNMQEDGVLKVFSGETSLEEVKRIIGFE